MFNVQNSIEELQIALKTIEHIATHLDTQTRTKQGRRLVQQQLEMLRARVNLGVLTLQQEAK
jgi:hypothetical protein